MSPESPSIFARLRAGLAATMAGLAGGARRMEDWSGRRGRALALILVPGLILVVGALVIASYGHSLAQEARGGRHAAEAHRMRPPKPAGTPERPGERGGRRDERPHGPRPEAPVAPPSTGPSTP